MFCFEKSISLDHLLEVVLTICLALPLLLHSSCVNGLRIVCLRLLNINAARHQDCVILLGESFSNLHYLSV